MKPLRNAAVAVAIALVAAACGDDANSGSGAGGDGGASGPGPGSGAGSPSTGVGGAITDPGCGADPAVHGGDATYYDADGSGNCSFDPSPEDLMVGAMNHDDYAASAACGACVHMVGPSGEATVRIVDQCPECPQGDIDLSPLAFAELADPVLGRVHIDWTYVSCEVTGPILYHFKEGSNQWWTAVQIRNATYAIATFEVMKDGAYVGVPRVDYNFFVDETGMGPGPYAFRVTDVKGHVVEDSGIPFIEAGDSAGAAQFPVCAGP